MALTLTQVELSAAIRLGDSPEETAEATRLLGYVTAAISTHLADAYEDAPEAIVNETGYPAGKLLYLICPKCWAWAHLCQCGPE